MVNAIIVVLLVIGQQLVLKARNVLIQAVDIMEVVIIAEDISFCDSCSFPEGIVLIPEGAAKILWDVCGMLKLCSECIEKLNADVQNFILNYIIN